MKKESLEEGLTLAFRVLSGLALFGVGFFLLYYDLYGMINKTQVPFLKTGEIYYLKSPILFWIFGVFWVFLSSFVMYLGINISLGKLR